MPPSDEDNSKITDHLDIDGWEIQSESSDRVDLLSDDRKDKIVIKPVSLSNAGIDTGYHIEYHSGEAPYARYRKNKGSRMATSKDSIEEEIQKLQSEHR